MDDRKLTPREVRKLIREEKITGQTSGFPQIPHLSQGKNDRRVYEY